MLMMKMLMIRIQSLNLHLLSNQSTHHMAHNICSPPYKQNQLKHMHQSFVSPPIVTLIQAININQLESIPFIKADLVQTHLPPSPATPEGRMERPKAGIRSIKKRKQEGRDTRIRHKMNQPSSQRKNQPVGSMRSTTFSVMLPW